VVFLLALFARLNLVLIAGTIRPEQPALFTLIVATAWYRSRLALPSIRPIVPLIVCGAVYLVVLTISSAFVAEEPALSLRMVAWTALSMIGGLVTALLVAGSASRVLPWFSGSAAIIAALGLIGAVGFLLFRLGEPLVAGTDGFYPKVYAFSHEPNLYASLLAAAIPIAAEVWRERPVRRNAAVFALLLLALGVGVTRAAYVGLAVGITVYFVLAFWRSRLSGPVRRMAAATVGFGLVGLIIPVFLMSPYLAGLLTPEGPLIAQYRPDGTTRPPSIPGSRGLEELGTLGYRMGMVVLGLRDMAESPLIGRGAFSFGQRHLEGDGDPAVIAVLPFAVAHDAGLIGFFALFVFLIAMLVRLWRAGRDKLLAGPVAALTGAVVVLLIAYLATTALHFTMTWLIVGSAIGATLPRSPTEEPDPGRQPESS
jgi:hypothetical protein